MKRHMHLLWFLLLASGLSACTSGARIDLLDPAAAPGAVQSILVATNRAHDPVTGAPGGGRSTALRYAEVGVAIPPDRQPGEIPLARSQSTFDPRLHFALAGVRQMDAAGFRATLADRLAALPPREREVMVIVHGYNTGFADGVYRSAQLDHDLNLPGVVVHFSWPSAAMPLAYANDRDSALFARDALEGMLGQITQAGARRVVLVGHSMGAHLVMETLRQLAIGTSPVMDRLDAVVLVSPDIDTDVFVAQARRVGSLPQPFFVVTSQRDQILRLSARLSGHEDRLGTLSDPARIDGLGVTLVDVSAFSTGTGHFTLGDSPALVTMMNQLGAVDAALGADRAGQLDLLPATVLGLRNTTQVILRPFGAR